MYAHTFGLTQDPFSIAPDPRFLFMSERHREALAHLLYGVSGPDGASGGAGGGFVLLTGDIGTGKTTICRCFLEQIPIGCHVAYIFNPKLTVTELLQSICTEFHITLARDQMQTPSARDYIDALNAFLLQSHADGQSCVLIIDEAQNLLPDVLEQLRLLTNLETNERKLLQIVLIGQPELRTMLERPELEQLSQRVIARFHLDALNAAETTHYIKHRLAVAGHTGELPFDARALARIHTITRGVPRRINLLCGRALLGSWANGQQRVNTAVVNKAAAEVFGPTATPNRQRHMRYGLAALALLASSALTGFVVWTLTPPAQPLMQTTAQVPPEAKTRLAAAATTRSLPTGQLTLPAKHTAEDAEALLARLSPDLTQAWRTLGDQWKLPALGSDPCLDAAQQGLQCYRASKLTLPQLRQLDRPGILTLQSGKTPPVFVVLVGLSEQTATLQVGTEQHTVRLVSLGRLWRGDFATYWRPPPGYVPELRANSTGPTIDLLAQQLARLEGVAAPAAASASGPQRLDEPLRARVRAFQRAQGLDADGQPGPLTFMQIERAIGLGQPRLQTKPS